MSGPGSEGFESGRLSVCSRRSGAALAVGSRFRGSQWLCASVAWRLFSGERAPLVWRACAQVRVFGYQFCASSSVRMPEWGARRLVPFLCGFESATCSRMIARVRVSGRASPRACNSGPATASLQQRACNSGPGDSGPGDRRATALPGAALILLDVCVVCACVRRDVSRRAGRAAPDHHMINRCIM